MFTLDDVRKIVDAAVKRAFKELEAAIMEASREFASRAVLNLLDRQSIRQSCPGCGEPGDHVVEDNHLCFICTNCGLVDPYEVKIRPRE